MIILKILLSSQHFFFLSLIVLINTFHFFDIEANQNKTCMLTFNSLHSIQTLIDLFFGLYLRLTCHKPLRPGLQYPHSDREVHPHPHCQSPHHHPHPHRHHRLMNLPLHPVLFSSWISFQPISSETPCKES